MSKYFFLFLVSLHYNDIPKNGIYFLTYLRHWKKNWLPEANDICFHYDVKNLTLVTTCYKWRSGDNSRSTIQSSASSTPSRNLIIIFFSFFLYFFTLLILKSPLLYCTPNYCKLKELKSILSRNIFKMFFFCHSWSKNQDRTQRLMKIQGFLKIIHNLRQGNFPTKWTNTQKCV